MPFIIMRIFVVFLGAIYSGIHRTYIIFRNSLKDREKIKIIKI